VLSLAALDDEDLAVISAHMQDAVLKVGDMAFTPGKKQFALVANRFAWDEADVPQRRRTGLHFDRVLSARTQNIRTREKDAVLSLLSISFRDTDTPSGEVLLTFSGGGAVLLKVECLEAQMRDLGPAWTAGSIPHHEIDDTQA
jgi:hypothetical protein